MRNIRIVTAAVALGLSSLVAVPSARADVADLWADIGLYSGNDVFALSPSAGARLYLGPAAAEARLGFVMLSPEVGDSVTRLENPWLAGYLTGSAGPLSYRYGLGVALPLAGGDNLEDVAALGIAGALDGLWNPWLFAPEQLGLVVPAHLEFEVPIVLTLIAEAGLGLMIDTGDAGDDDVDVGAQLAVEARVEAIPIFKPGLRLQTVLFLTSDGDKDQNSIMPYLRFAFGPAWAQLGLLLNLDEPFGFSFDDGKIWGLHLSGGASI